MRVTLLGTGGAGGVPMISVGWGKCDPAQPKNRRRRTSILVEQGDTTVLVDTGPDLRAQLLDVGVRHLDAIVYTHDHADHLNGVDDIREVNRAMDAEIPAYADRRTLEALTDRFGYVLEPMAAEATSIYKPQLRPIEIDGPFTVGDLDVVPFEQDHGWTTTLGFRFGPIAYSTDVVELGDKAFETLENVDTWIVGCLVDKPHPTHAHVDKVIGWFDRVKPRRLVLTHMSPRLDYDTLKAALPAGMEPGFDGLVLEA